MCKVSIIIPTYNSQNTILQTLDSLNGQQDNPRIHSIVIADDYSTDETVAICQKNMGKWPKLKIFPSDQNQGERRNINRILDYLRQEGVDWFLILHSDDIAKPSWIQENLFCITASDDKIASICSSWDDWYPHEDRVQSGENKIEPLSIRIEGSKESIVDTFRQGCWWHVSGCAIRVNAFERIGGFAPDLPQLGDFEWLLRALSNGWAIQYIPRSLILYRQHPHSVSSNSFKKDRDTIEFLGILKNHLKVIDFKTFFFLWRQKLSTSLRRLVKSFVLRDLALIRQRIQTLLLLNITFIKLTFIKTTDR